jgi:glycosyltransferase involved in cell wall biosynthesis
MQAGVPVVATGAGSLREVLGDAALIVEPGDHDGLVAALETCLDDNSVRQRLCAAGTVHAATFSWERCGEELEALYRDVAGSTSG